jgi:hypothetical protein
MHPLHSSRSPTFSILDFITGSPHPGQATEGSTVALSGSLMVFVLVLDSSGFINYINCSTVEQIKKMAS